MALTESTMLELGTNAPDFALTDVVTGKLVSRDDFRDKKALLVMFICTHCPYVKHVEKGLAALGRDYAGKLLDSSTINRYELQPDRIVFYLWSSAAEGDQFTFRFTPRYSIRAKAAPAKLVDYYNPDLGAVLAPQSFDVGSMPHQ